MNQLTEAAKLLIRIRLNQIFFDDQANIVTWEFDVFPRNCHFGLLSILVFIELSVNEIKINLIHWKITKYSPNISLLTKINISNRMESWYFFKNSKKEKS